MVLFLTVDLDTRSFLKSVPTSSTSLIHLRSLSTGERHPLAGNTGILEYTVIDLGHSPLSVQISGKYVGILFLVESENGREWTKELVVWSWRTGVRKAVSTEHRLCLRHNKLTDLISRFYQSICDPLRFSAIILSWDLHRNHLRC